MAKFEPEQPVFNEFLADVQLLRVPHTAISGTKQSQSLQTLFFLMVMPWQILLKSVAFLGVGSIRGQHTLYANTPFLRWRLD